MKKLICSAAVLLALGITACAPRLYPDMPDDKTCYDRIQEITTRLKESDTIDLQTYAALNPEPYLSVLCARGTLRKVCISLDRKQQMRNLVKLINQTPEIIYWQESGRAVAFQNYENPTHETVTLYFLNKDIPQILAMLRRIYGK